MRFYKTDIVLQEVPNEISLCISICGCPLRCKGCHSPFLWKENNGAEFTAELLQKLITRYEGMITCVLFMGGEWHAHELITMMDICKNHHLKTCLYTGQDYVHFGLLKKLDYIKTGPWISNLGGLDTETTNQKFREVRSGKNLNYLFKKRKYDTINRTTN